MVRVLTRGTAENAEEYAYARAPFGNRQDTVLYVYVTYQAMKFLDLSGLKMCGTVGS